MKARTIRRLAWLTVALLICVALFLAQCSLVKPRIDSSARLEFFPKAVPELNSSVRVYWNRYQVPYIEAQSDDDLFFALGLVQAHLRLAQITILRRAAQGRLSESAGPFTTSLDFALRTLNPGRAVSQMRERLPAETARLVERFAAGLNFYQNSMAELPAEFELLGLEPEPWTVDDILLMSRLAGADVTWFAYSNLLKQNPDDAALLWRKFLQFSGSGTTPAMEQSALNISSSLLSNSARLGSNSVAVSAARSGSGAPLIASDPHLGFALPNFWMLVGLNSPGFKAVGLMLPGVPFLGIGRNADVAWGGTNMRAAVSDIVDVTDGELSSRTETVKRRAWFDTERTVRESAFGPVISDLPFIKAAPGRTLALRWVGHMPSDEISAFLGAMRAKSGPELRQSFSTFAVSPQNILFADRHGNIGQVFAGSIPQRAGFGPEFVRTAEQAKAEWSKLMRSTDLPLVLNPPEGIVASANNKPRTTSEPISFWFSPDDRVERMIRLLSSGKKVSLEDLKALQQDVRSEKAAELARQLSAYLKNCATVSCKDLASLLLNWRGDYFEDSREALAFEVFLATALPQLFEVNEIEELPPYASQWPQLSAALLEKLEGPEPLRVDGILSRAADKTMRIVERQKTWGAVHRLRVGHLLAGVPVIGRLFTLAEYPVGGSRETLMKTAHGLKSGRHTANYGSQARHISDLSTPDSNYFVVLGGQDGWLESVNFADQVELWRRGDYIRMPLSMELVREEFSMVHILTGR